MTTSMFHHDDPQHANREATLDTVDDAPATLSRRGFLGGTAVATASAAAGTLTLGLAIPFGNSAHAQASGAAIASLDPEVNAWVVIKPDDQVIVRIARSEMGQGTLTGLAQLVAEELECDWSKVSTEYPTPGQNVARQRVWQNFSTGGSRGIRESHDYVRRGGATARMMLVQAAAVAGACPPPSAPLPTA
jgi:isoquinoline 1-oxidoreductase subunit beta